MQRILVTGACGQVGSELIRRLSATYGVENIIGLDLKPLAGHSGPFEIADVTNENDLKSVIRKYEIDAVYHLVGILSAKGEQNPDLAWNVNVNSLKFILDLAIRKKLRLFWPSSIAVFGPTTPKKNTPQSTILEPTTMYGVTKVAGELLCQYYHAKFGVDVRSVRFPGLISYKTAPGGGTTDYAVDIFHHARRKKRYVSFLKEDTRLPMMYMDDAIDAVLQLMDADAENLTVRTSYNLAAVSFSVEEIASEIREHLPEFQLFCDPDFRQDIADSWPDSIDDGAARRDWQWRHKYDLPKLTPLRLD